MIGLLPDMPPIEIKFQTERTRKFRVSAFSKEDEPTIAHIEEFGCYVVNVKRTNYGLGWSYTVGVFDTSGKPEIITTANALIVTNANNAERIGNIANGGMALHDMAKRPEGVADAFNKVLGARDVHEGYRSAKELMHQSVLMSRNTRCRFISTSEGVHPS